MTSVEHGGGVWHLRAAGTSVLLDASGPAPAVVHWGADLGTGLDLPAVVRALRAPSRSGLDARGDETLVLLPQTSRGWPGRPGLSVSVPGRGEPALTLRDQRPGADGVTFTLTGWDASLELVAEVRLDDAGVLLVRHRLVNRGAVAVAVAQLNLLLPLPQDVDEVLDTTGRWGREAQPQRHPLGFGAWVRESRHGRPGHDAPLLLVAAAGPVRNRSGRCWGVHLGWSGDRAVWAERAQGYPAALGAGELLGPGEVELAPGESYETPVLHAVFSERGLDGLSSRLHRHLRARPQHPRRPRPVTLNTWEAVYFDHDLAKLRALADRAAEVGVERFVLDDGWFRGRRDDAAGLGDWYVDDDVWPQGLGPLADHVRSLGMEFGLWFEPEMVNPDSDLLRTHPDWALRVDGELPVAWRHQQTLDLQHTDVFAYLLERLTTLVGDYGVTYVKWDHNRDVFGVDHAGRPAVHGQTLALYRLLDALRAAHPGLEIESCASGGGRIDLGILARTDRVWTSDTIDALERVGIQRWTSLLLPPELMGAHVGGPQAHTTGRRHDLSFRYAVALLGHLGIEWDLTTLGDEELARVAAGVAFAKRWRTLIHTGELVNGDLPWPSAALSGVVSDDRRQALYVLAQLTGAEQESPTSVRLPGLAADVDYRVTLEHPLGEQPVPARVVPPWLHDGEVVVPGTVLVEAGLPLPALRPEQALVLAVTAVERPGFLR